MMYVSAVSIASSSRRPPAGGGATSSPAVCGPAASNVPAYPWGRPFGLWLLLFLSTVKMLLSDYMPSRVCMRPADVTAAVERTKRIGKALDRAREDDPVRLLLPDLDDLDAKAPDAGRSANRNPRRGAAAMRRVRSSSSI